ncbi:WD40 repeat domain-containing protein [Streptomyces sp. TRM66268-LWL]|uniref:WD40 repeat domain-containing protein n=1 Tax=Streptomyces polyasparticus TaxID=2767826 RepID=A0ABR7SPD8_9ACTN|nr:WD40 repeat domain-containing protein [Streptomyces polyasparticus]MBC9716457.1 WD40 repeat domain-containing protein [Streptomyces polyasparticus]
MRLLLGAAVTAALVLGPVSAARADNEGFTIEDPRITESSGLVASKKHPGVYWTHNDSDDGSHLYAVDSKSGRTVARVTMQGVGQARDVEGISIGPDGDLYVGDIGDNLGGTWDHVWIYRLPEPDRLGDQTVKATQYDVTYADGARDAEAIMVHPKTGRVYIADKQRDENGGLYEGPAELRPGKGNVFTRIGDIDLWTTDGAFSPDGGKLVLRSYFGAQAYDWKDGRIRGEGERVDVPLQRQGESVAYSPDGTKLMYGSEGSGSQVEPVDAPDAPKSPGGGGGSGSDRASDDAGADGDGTDFTSGAIAVAAVLLLVFGLKGLLRKKS